MIGVLMFPRLVVLAAAWWHWQISGFSVWAAQWPASLSFWLCGHPCACRADRWTQKLVLFLLAEWLAWAIAGDYLSAKYEAELLEDNRRFDLENSGWRDKL